jgi:hypothetical protein
MMKVANSKSSYKTCPTKRALVERMLALHKNLASAKTPQEKESMQRQVESTDGAIDKLVYELYGLSEEEIGIVEGK